MNACDDTNGAFYHVFHVKIQIELSEPRGRLLACKWKQRWPSIANIDGLPKAMVKQTQKGWQALSLICLLLRGVKIRQSKSHPVKNDEIDTIYDTLYILNT